jgi:hypothetical protein
VGTCLFLETIILNTGVEQTTDHAQWTADRAGDHRPCYYGDVTVIERGRILGTVGPIIHNWTNIVTYVVGLWLRIRFGIRWGRWSRWLARRFRFVVLAVVLAVVFPSG